MSASKIGDSWQDRRWFAGLDWGRKAHQLVVVDPSGERCLTLRFEHAAAGWDRARNALVELAGSDLSVVAVAIETRVGPAVEKLLELGCTVYPTNPKATSRYRDRKAPSGTKDDNLDAWSLADALRTDGHAWSAMQAEDPLIQQIRLLCRNEVAMIVKRTACVNALRQALHEYYPAALEAFSDWTKPATWAFVKRFPTPHKLVRAGKRSWDKFLHTHRLYRRQTYEHRIECFSNASNFCGSQAVTASQSLLVLALADELQVLQKHLMISRHEIDHLFDLHPAGALFDSLPGAGTKLAPRLLAESGSARQRFDDVKGLECYAGVVPVRFQSGQMNVTRVRRACCKPLRHALHLWANTSRRKSNWAQAYYQRKRRQGKSHACALRCLARRWIRILWKMLETGRPYDEAMHLRDQIQHGSWILQPAPYQPPTRKQTC
jgi:transposase